MSLMCRVLSCFSGKARAAPARAGVAERPPAVAVTSTGQIPPALQSHFQNNH